MIAWYETILIPLHDVLLENVLEIISCKTSTSDLGFLKIFTSSISMVFFWALEKVSDSITKFSEPVYHRLLQQDLFNYLRAIYSSLVSEKKTELDLTSFISWLHHKINEEIRFCRSNFIGVDFVLFESMLTEIFVEKYKTDIASWFVPSLNGSDKKSLPLIFSLLSHINTPKENGILGLKSMFEAYCLDFSKNYFSSSHPKSEHPCLVSHMLALYNYLIELCWDCFGGSEIFIEIVEKVSMHVWFLVRKAAYQWAPGSIWPNSAVFWLPINPIVFLL